MQMRQQKWAAPHNFIGLFPFRPFMQWQDTHTAGHTCNLQINTASTACQAEQ